jgi:hypothetical protein
VQVERELIERQRQPHAAGLDVGLLQGPVIEEQPRLVSGRTSPQIAHFIGGEMPLRHRLEDGAGHRFDVDANAVAARDRQRHQPLGVRDVEGQPGDAGLIGGHERTLVRVADESPVGWRGRAIERQPGAD